MMRSQFYYPAPAGQVSYQPLGNAVVTAMEIVVATIVVVGIAVAYEYSQRKSR